MAAVTAGSFIKFFFRFHNDQIAASFVPMVYEQHDTLYVYKHAKRTDASRQKKGGCSAQPPGLSPMQFNVPDRGPDIDRLRSFVYMAT